MSALIHHILAAAERQAGRVNAGILNSYYTNVVHRIINYLGTDRTVLSHSCSTRE